MTQNAGRCPWCGDDPMYVAYHDAEWGVPERDPRALWELLVLEGFQAGLSWITILRKRAAFRRAFAGFDPDVLAHWGEADVQRLLGDPGIVRHRGKIAGTFASARAWQGVQAEGGFSAFVWSFVQDRPVQGRRAGAADVPVATPAANALSGALRARGFAFCGPRITYAFMQAAGLVNDHLVTCPAHDRVAALARAG